MANDADGFRLTTHSGVIAQVERLNLVWDVKPAARQPSQE